MPIETWNEVSRMFRFVCPMCQFGMEVSESKSGSKTRCQRCGQKLLIPMPPQRSIGKSKKGAAGGVRRYTRQLVGAVLVMGLVAGGYYFVYIPIAEAGAGKTVEVRDYARNAPERAVRDTLRKNVIKGDLIKFEKWGPHLYRREWESMLRLAEKEKKDEALKLVKIHSFDAVVRLAYELPERAVVTGSMGQYSAGKHDVLFAVKGPYITLLDGINGGDDWKDLFEKNLLKSSGGTDSSSDKLRGK
jgi:hypothetical protein